MFIDTHTHLFVEQFSDDRNQIVQRAIDAGVEICLLPNIDESTIDSMNALSASFPRNCYPMMGLHPGSVGANVEEQLEKIRKELFGGSYVAVGEIGMDLYWDTTYLKEQEIAFRTQVNWAKELQLPIAIHAREAFDEIFAVLDELNDDRLTGVFHCFTGTKEQANKALGYGGFKLGIGGVVTYKKADLGASIEHVSLDDLVLETDSPYLAPVPFRGKRNESAYLLHVAEKVADIYGVSMKEVEERTTKAAIDLFKLDTLINQ